MENADNTAWSVRHEVAQHTVQHSFASQVFPHARVTIQASTSTLFSSNKAI